MATSNAPESTYYRNLAVVTAAHSKETHGEIAEHQEELVRRVASSITFEKSPRLRAFLLHVCRCALENKPGEATEHQIGVNVYGRLPTYNPNEDNIVRSQARLLRMKLEHHFINDGKDESVVIKIPKGQYLPVFETRPIEPPAQPDLPIPSKQKTPRLRSFLPVVAVVLLGLWLAKSIFRQRPTNPPTAVVPANSVSVENQSKVDRQSTSRQAALASGANEVYISTGLTGAPYLDVLGRRWVADRYYRGGVVRPGPRHFFPPVADEGQFRSIREAASDDNMVPRPERDFEYDIPVPSGVYELRLYFADPLRQSDVDQREDSQNDRHFQIDLNGSPLLADLDPIADAGSAAVDIRVFKDVHPAADGKVHLTFHSTIGKAFVSALELTPGMQGKLKPIRIAARQSDFIDSNGIRWGGDKYFIDGRTWLYENPESGPRVPPLYTGERHGNFSYSIPVTPGSYTVKLHFLESFFSPLIPAAGCYGVGCRVFDVTCNGVMLLQNFDIFQTAGGAFLPVIREFHGLHPNGQGKLLLSFSPKVNYAEIRAIEVIDETK